MNSDENRRPATVVLPEPRTPQLRRWVLLLIVLGASGAAAVDPGPMRALRDLPDRARVLWRDAVWGGEGTWDGAVALPPLPPGEASSAAPAPDSGAPSPVVSPPEPTSVTALPERPSRPARPATMSRTRSGDRAAAPRVRSRVAAPAAVVAGSRPPRGKQVSARPSDTGVALPGTLSVQSVPWGALYLDGQLIGNTPRVDLPVPPGRHRIRVERTGFVAFDTTISILAGAPTRLTSVTLQSTP